MLNLNDGSAVCLEHGSNAVSSAYSQSPTLIELEDVSDRSLYRPLISMAVLAYIVIAMALKAPEFRSFRPVPQLLVILVTAVTSFRLQLVASASILVM